MADERLEVRLGRRLREARIRANLTVREAADATGLPDHSILVRYENGAARAPLDRLAALAGAYNTTLAALLAERDETVPLIAQVERASQAALERVRAALATPLPSPRSGDTTADVPF